ncbi:hypothetical protein ACUN0C_15210 [Faunimonas sp. B44]|uniref:hypothetical protein n=1 Tax=Faunimonas sp. B44 TaxID=3461493 RepID=UPI004044917C
MGADRQRRYRRRQAEGLRVVAIEIDEAALGDLLVDIGLLSLAEADDLDNIRAALQQLVADMAIANLELE